MTSRVEERGQNSGSSMRMVRLLSMQGEVGVILQSLKRDRLKYAICLQF